MDIENLLQNTIIQLSNNFRDILSNIKRSQKAITERDLRSLEKLIEERLDLLDANEYLYGKFLSTLHPFAELKKITPPAGENPSLNLLLNWLCAALQVEEIELQFNLQKLRNILDELHNQNNLTKHYLSSKSLLDMEDHFHKKPSPFEPKPRAKPKKIALQLLIPENEDEENFA